ncbi:putative late blight resistance protein homolog R1A-3 [Solanum verrucosum]|uniref:putative late blight resistance protein homolog R1A-3 n=1 Tax=Solanum verrucosum TaxID=315347 RepID=UPI0020D1DEF0|nr:putative late blight resistance protein homolog R1A-3 [Solanum verrucosum]
MANAAVISLVRSLEELVQRKPHLISDETRRMVDSVLDSLEYFQAFLESTSKRRQKYCRKVEELEREIRMEVEKAEDVIELKIMDGIMKKEGLSKTFLRTLVGKIDAPRERKAIRKTLLPFVKKIDAVKRNVMGSSFGANQVQGYDDSTNEDLLPGHSSRNVAKLNPENIVVGLQDDLVRIIRRLKGHTLTREIIPILGMGGIGKTTLARKAFDDFETRHRFDIHIWVTVSQEYWIRGMLMEILRCISELRDTISIEYRIKSMLLDNLRHTSDETQEVSNDRLMDSIYKKLKGRRYLVVMDDIWSSEVWDLLTRIFPDDNNGSRIILTSRQEEVANHADPDSNPHEMNLLNSDNSWKLLREKVFGVEQACPPELQYIGVEIAQRCQGLPLALLVVAGHLSKISRTRVSWEHFAISVSNVVTNESDICLGILALSYNYLPDHLKPCFLYMGVFPEDSNVNIVRLINLWISEGFLSDELEGRDYFEDLVSRNLVMVRNRSFSGEAKTCGVHDLIGDLILKEAKKEKFLQVTKPSEEKLRHPRRYSFHSRDQAAFWKLSNIIRTLHFFEGFKKLSKQVPLLVSFKLLRVLAILKVTFQRFPLEITKLVQLRYLQFNCYDHIHWSVSELYNLQTFILGYQVAGLLPPTIPVEIWQMRNLRHLHIGDFFSFPIPSNKLQNLQELSCLALTSCTSELFSAIPNLKKLQIVGNYLMEMKRERLNSLSCLKELEILKYRDDGIKPSRIPSMYALPTSLKRLTLRFTSLPWEDMANIVKLPNLEVLKIKDNGFLGDVWKLNDEEIFNQLKFLLISWAGLKHWEASSVNFPKLQRLFLKRCMNLEEIPQDFGEICTLESIELHDCSISAAKSGKDIKEEQESMGNECLSVLIYNHPC